MLLVLPFLVGYSEFGAPVEFGNATTTTCWIGGDDGELRCLGELNVSSIVTENMNISGGFTVGGMATVGTLNVTNYDIHGELHIHDTLWLGDYFDGDCRTAGEVVQYIDEWGTFYCTSLDAYNNSDLVYSLYNNTPANCSDGYAVTGFKDNFSTTYCRKFAEYDFGDNDFNGSGNFITTGVISTPEIFNTDGDLKIMPDVQGHVNLFADTDVGDGESSKALRLYRKAVEGDSYMYHYIDKDFRAYMGFTHSLRVAADGGWLILQTGGSPIYIRPAGANSLYLHDLATGNVEAFANADVAAAVDGKSFYVHRKAVEGDAYIQMYVEDDAVTGVINPSGNKLRIDGDVDVIGDINAENILGDKLYSDGVEITPALYLMEGDDAEFNSVIIEPDPEPFCYQETATTSTICGGFDTGSYGCAGTWHSSYPCSNAYDGNWGSFGTAYPSDSFLYVNYTKPTGSLGSSLWLIKDAGATINLTIPSNCFSESPLQFKVRAKYSSPYEAFWSCWNSTDWEQLRDGGSASFQIYEEAMWWNITTTSLDVIGDVIIDGTITATNVQITAPPGCDEGDVIKWHVTGELYCD